MSDEKETVKLQISESFLWENFNINDFDEILGFFDWSLNENNIEVNLSDVNNRDVVVINLIFLYLEFVILNQCKVFVDGNLWKGYNDKSPNRNQISNQIDSTIADLSHQVGLTTILNYSLK